MIRKFIELVGELRGAPGFKWYHLFTKRWYIEKDGEIASFTTYQFVRYLKENDFMWTRY